MLLFVITQVLTIPFASLYLSTILIHRFAFLIFLFYEIFSWGVEILGGLFQTSLLFQIPFILDSFSFIEEPDILLSLIPIIVYSNAETEKSTILTDNKGKTGIYLCSAFFRLGRARQLASGPNRVWFATLSSCSYGGYW